MQKVTEKYVAISDVYDTLTEKYHHTLGVQHEALKEALAAVPAADARHVVLCRDCLHYEMGACLKIYDDGAANKDAWQERKPDDFCSYVESRKES